MEIQAEHSTKRTSRRDWTHPGWLNVTVAVLPLLACFLGGATEKWSEGIVIFLFGLLLILNPPRHSLGWALNGTMAALVVCAAVAFLPSHWFFEPPWRVVLSNDFGITLPKTLSPQPWFTSGCLVSFVAGLSWFYYICAREVGMHEVRFQVRVFAGGIVLLASTCILISVLHIGLPFWHNARGFGPFPNRNQTGDLLGITAVMLLASGQDDFRRGRVRWILSVFGFVIIIAALILNYSRAGVVILVCGSALWLVIMAFRNQTPARIAIGASMLLVILATLLIFGGQTIERFRLLPLAGDGISTDFRWLIFRDTWRMIQASPWCGIGLGNFESIFAFSRIVSVADTRSIHPESDWLWLWSELGWPAVFLVFTGMFLVMQRAFPLREGTNQRFRLAALIAAIIFALHGLIDVSAHRVGTALAALFLFGLAVHRPFSFRSSRLVPVVFRVLGTTLVAIGVIWIGSVRYRFALPGSLGVDMMRRAATLANRSLGFEEMIADASRGLEWAPLDWRLYFLRALGKIGAGKTIASALDDFRRARFLEPNGYEVPFEEGNFWLTRRPILAITAWREALRRAGSRKAEIYGQMFFDSSQMSDTFLDELAQLAGGEPELIIAGLTRIPVERFAVTLNAFLKYNPDLRDFSPDKKAQVLSLWAQRGSLDDLMRAVETHPEWRGSAWEGLSKFYAGHKDFQAAVEIARQFAPPPAFPPMVNHSSVKEMQQNFFADPTNYLIGASLCREQLREGKIDDALVTARHFTGQPGSPGYFHFLEAECWVAKQNWERAWDAWLAFQSAK